MNKALQKKLALMAKKDQDMRRGGKWNSSIDKKNTQELKKIIERFGWPTISLVGKRGASDAWLIAQHADLDKKFQRLCLKLITEASRKKEAIAKDLAFLTDRVRVHQAKKQVYGTQFYRTKNKRFVNRPIYKKGDLNRRRKSVGLEPFEKYKKLMIKMGNKLKRNK